MIEIPGIPSEMIANNLTPCEATHPGEVIKDELEARKVTQKSFAAQIGVKASYLSEIIHGKRNVNTEMALLLEAAWGISASFWLNMQADYNMHVAKSDVSFMNRLASIRKVVAVL